MSSQSTEEAPEASRAIPWFPLCLLRKRFLKGFFIALDFVLVLKDNLQDTINFP